MHFIISFELQWLQKCKYATAGHVNPKKPTTGKIGTVYPQPMLWRRLWGYKANLKLQQIKAVITEREMPIKAFKKYTLRYGFKTKLSLI